MKSLVLASVASLLLLGTAWARDGEGDKTRLLLQELLKMDTGNPPGDTRQVASYLKTLFDAAGIENETILAPNGKAAHFFARLKGDGSKRPVLLAAHTDVVPAEKGSWSVEPFSGIQKDGYLWGRGALDNKGAVAAFARAMLRLKTTKIPLKRDVIFLAEADEEQGQFNTTWLAENHWDQMDAEFALNEGGAVVSENGKVKQINVTYADKVSVTIRVKTSGKTGHSSRPLPIDVTANGQLISALERLQHYNAPIQLTPEARNYFTKLAKLNPGLLSAAIDQLLAAQSESDRLAAAKAVMANGEAGWGVEGLLHNTLVVMMITAGFKANAMPNHAEATLNARLMPGTDVEAFLDDLRKTIGNPQVQVEIVSTLPSDQVVSYYRERVAIKSSTLDTELYRAIERSAALTWPGAPVLPTLLVAGTDATPWRKRGVPVYGISPFPVEPGDPLGVHGNDERVKLSGMDKGSDYIYRIVSDVAQR